MLPLILSIYFAFTLFVAGVSKFDDLSYFRATLRVIRLLPGHTIHIVSQFIAGFEVIFAIILILGVASIEAAIINLVLFVSFIIFKLFVFLRKLPPECGCFGATYKARIDPVSITVSSIQIGLALIYLFLVLNADVTVTDRILHIIGSISFLAFAAWIMIRLWYRHQYKPLKT